MKNDQAALNDVLAEDLRKIRRPDVDVSISLAFTVPAFALPGLLGQLLKNLPLSSSIEIETREVWEHSDPDQQNRSE